MMGLGMVLAAASLHCELNLAGAWQLTGTDAAGRPVECPISVPGDVQSALLAAGKMVNPYFGSNETNIQWVGDREWTVRRQFDCDEAVLGKRAVWLRLDAVDTFATVSLNGQVLGETDNRFRRWEYDVKRWLRRGENELTLSFHPAKARAAEIARNYDHHFPMNVMPVADNEFQAYIRKPACHAGWDWGPIQMTVGPCGKVELLAFDDCKIDYVYSTQRFNDDLTHCDLKVVVEATDPTGRSLTVTNDLAIDHPPLWWPNGAGERKFYEYELTVAGRTLRRRIGLRKLEVDRTDGAMNFKVNNRSLFMKGANWIPCDAFAARQTPARMRDLLTSAAAANMNMIRVWGGGQFESDEFYELCDELGLLLWHDFMFSCAMYPGDERFLAGVRAELRHQLRRLRDHASIALWCGGNECIGALNWFKESKLESDRQYYREHLHRRHQLSAEMVAMYDPTRLFWPSSPCAGPGSLADNWKNDASGDMHNWQVWHDTQPFEQYYQSRPWFCSEFGYQSFSSREVAKTFCGEGQLKSGAPDFEWHQKNTGGNKIIRNNFQRYFQLPKDTEAMLYLSQVQQALAIRTAVEFWRTLRPRTMGTLYWQLNDMWPVASWSSLEYGGERGFAKWKHLHYQARRFYAPLAVVGTHEGDIVVLNDLAAKVPVKVAVEHWSFAGELLKTEQLQGEVAADSVLKIGRLIPEKDAFVHLVLEGAGRRFENDWFFGKFKDCALSAAKVSYSITEPKGTVPKNAGTVPKNVGTVPVEVELKTDKPAFFVWANAEGVPGEFSDNSFTLLPGRPVTLKFVPKTDCDLTTFARAFSVTHLRESY